MSEVTIEVGQTWEYVGENEARRGKGYSIIEILPAVKKPNFGWHRGIRYVPHVCEAGAPNDYTRLEDDFRSCFRLREALQPRA